MWFSDLFQPLLFNTLQVRNALGAAQKRKLSFKNVSNVVVQLIHSIKYSMEVPFSNMAAVQEHKPQSRKVSDTIEFLFYNGLFVFAWRCFLLCVRYLILEWYGRLYPIHVQGQKREVLIHLMVSILIIATFTVEPPLLRNILKHWLAIPSSSWE